MVSMALLTFTKSFAPKYCEMTTVVPITSPIISETIIKITGNDAPTAASASLPINFPTTMLSTTLKSCWNNISEKHRCGKLKNKLSFLSDCQIMHPVFFSDAKERQLMENYQSWFLELHVAGLTGKNSLFLIFLYNNHDICRYQIRDIKY